MKTMVLTGIRQMEMREVPDPVIKSDKDVLIRMATVGVCGSDVHYYLTGRIGSRWFSILRRRHEGAGVVEKVGAKVKRVKPATDRHRAGHAVLRVRSVQAGRQHTCRKLRFLGCPGQAEGCLSQYIVMRRKVAFPFVKR
jgi:L-iditol 2-dehydrogenase